MFKKIILFITVTVIFANHTCHRAMIAGEMREQYAAKNKPIHMDISQLDEMIFEIMTYTPLISMSQAERWVATYQYYKCIAALSEHKDSALFKEACNYLEYIEKKRQVVIQRERIKAFETAPYYDVNELIKEYEKLLAMADSSECPVGIIQRIIELKKINEKCS